DGRPVLPIDDGYLSEQHAAIAAQRPTDSTRSGQASAQRPTSNAGAANGGDEQRSHHGDFMLKRSMSNGQNGQQSAVRTPQSAIGRKPLRAKPGKVVTQLWYARQGIITPE